MSFELYRFVDSQERDVALAKSFAAIMRGSIEQGQDCRIAFSGGRSPISFFQYLSKENLDWHKCHISLVDERIISTDHDDSNAKLLRSFLLKNHAANANFTPLLRDSSTHIDDLLNIANRTYKQPDFALIGMGEDGHTASLFTDANEFDYAISTHERVVVTTPRNAPYQRLSLSLNALQDCRKLFLSISGDRKIAILREAIKGINPLLPISYILHSRKVCCDVYYS